VEVGKRKTIFPHIQNLELLNAAIPIQVFKLVAATTLTDGRVIGLQINLRTLPFPISRIRASSKLHPPSSLPRHIRPVYIFRVQMNGPVHPVPVVLVPVKTAYKLGVQGR